jgi:hypothetical protein
MREIILDFWISRFHSLIVVIFADLHPKFHNQLKRLPASDILLMIVKLGMENAKNIMDLCSGWRDG